MAGPSSLDLWPTGKEAAELVEGRSLYCLEKHKARASTWSSGEGRADAFQQEEAFPSAAPESSMAPRASNGCLHPKSQAHTAAPPGPASGLGDSVRLQIQLSLKFCCSIQLGASMIFSTRCLEMKVYLNVTQEASDFHTQACHFLSVSVMPQNNQLHRSYNCYFPSPSPTADKSCKSGSPGCHLLGR